MWANVPLFLSRLRYNVQYPWSFSRKAEWRRLEVLTIVFLVCSSFHSCLGSCDTAVRIFFISQNTFEVYDIYANGLLMAARLCTIEMGTQFEGSQRGELMRFYLNHGLYITLLQAFANSKHLNRRAFFIHIWPGRIFL